MIRRNFLRALTLAGLGVMAPHGTRRVHAGPARHAGPYWVFVHAAGGWDPTCLCDPKGGEPKNRDSINQNYEPSAIAKAGAIAYAPLSTTLTYDGGEAELFSSQRFFEAHGAKLLCVNGVDTATNNHDTGTRAVWSGKLEEGFPSLAALIAAAKTRELAVPVPFISYGGFDATMDLVPITRAANADALRRIAYPNRLDPSKADSARYHSDETLTRIEQAQRERLAARKDRGLPFTRRAMNSLYLSRSMESGLGELADALSAQPLVSLETFPDLAKVRGQLGGLESLMRQAQLVVQAFRAGVAVSANLQVGGFDTHSGHDANQTRALMTLLRGLDYLYTAAGEASIADQLYVVVGSDFGRTPYYNEGNGKDHWNVTSMMLSGPGIAGGRVIGATDAQVKPVRVSPTSLELRPGVEQDEADAVRITTPAIHQALRGLAGIGADPAVQRYALPGTALPLFG